jgi:hypothetical protein
MPDDKSKGVVEISSEPAAGSEPAHVSVIVDGDRRFTVRTSDLENIGAQLRGKKGFSWFYSIGLPIMISLLTVVGTTLVGQFFQYVSWRNSTELQNATDRAARAKTAYEAAARAISERYDAAKLFLDAANDLANRKTDIPSKLFVLDLERNKQHVNAFYDQLKRWNTSYDQLLSDIDSHMDRPILWHSQRVSIADFRGKFRCDAMLFSELGRLKMPVHSLKVQFAAVSYCFDRSLLPFDHEIGRAVMDKDFVIPPGEKRVAAQANIDARAMSNEFRCYAQRRIALYEQQKRKAIFKLSNWLSDKVWRVDPNDAIRRSLVRALEDCDFSKPAKRGGRFRDLS